MKTTSQDIKAILLVLKRTLRARGLVYSDLAGELDISEVTIKRLFSGASVSMNHLLAICDFLQISFLEVAMMARELEHSEYVLSKEQDLFFANQVRSYALFIDLYRRKSASEVMEYWKLTDQKFFKHLREFEKIGLLEVLPHNRYRFKVSGPIKIPKDGQLIQHFYDHNLEFLEYVQKRVMQPEVLLQTSEVFISKDHADEFLNEFQVLVKKFRSHAFMDETMLMENQKKSVRWLFAFSPYETDWRND